MYSMISFLWGGEIQVCVGTHACERFIDLRVPLQVLICLCVFAYFCKKQLWTDKLEMIIHGNVNGVEGVLLQA